MRETLVTRQRLEGFAPLSSDAELPGIPVLDGILRPIPRAASGIRAIRWTRTAREDDGFCIASDGSAVEIRAGLLRAALYGCYLLAQYAEENGGLLPIGEMECTPRCAFRSLKLYLPEPDRLDEFYSIIDVACRFRVNTILLELGGGMEYRRHPEINAAWKKYCRDMTTYPQRANDVQHSCAWDKDSIHFENAGGSVLSQETIKELLRYCRERGLSVIPEQPTLSHADYILCAHPEFAERPDDPYPDTYCPSNPDVYLLVFDLLDEVLEVFEPEIVHIGHDEYYSMCVCPQCRKKTGAQVYAEDITQIHDYLAQRGVKTMIWAEKLINAVDSHGTRYGGADFTRLDDQGNIIFHRPETWQAIDMIPRDVICMHWYWGIGLHFDEEYLRRGFPMVYGNYNALGMVNWAERIRAGGMGGGPSHWSSVEWTTFQRNAVAACLLCASMMYWTEEYREDNFRDVLQVIFEELYAVRNGAVLRGPHLEIVHTTTVERPYVYISSQPMELDQDHIGNYTVTWSNGETLEIPVLYGVNITHRDRSWARTLDGEKPGLDGWDSYRFDQLLVEVAGIALPIARPDGTAFRFVVENPYPDAEIVSVRVRKTAQDDGEIQLLSFSARPGCR